MPGPFPGMDPFLESSDWWRGAHHLLIAKTAEVLNAALPERYFARIDKTVYEEMERRHVYPDLSIVDQVRERKARTYGSRTAVDDPPDPPGILVVEPIEMQQGFIEIRTIDSDDRIITVIELLSHSNKSSGSVGRKKYKQKQEEMLAGDGNFLEIDLLRRGLHTVAAPEHELLERGVWDYLVCLHRATNRYKFEYWMIGLRDRLPRVVVPLEGDDPDQTLDLQKVFDAAFEAGAFGRQLRYEREPVPPLSPADTAWADELLRSKGLRPA